MKDKDSYEFQQARVIRIIGEVAPGKLVEFDTTSTWIRFKIKDPVTGIRLTVDAGEWEPSELADKSDDWLRAFIKQIGNGQI